MNKFQVRRVVFVVGLISLVVGLFFGLQWMGKPKELQLLNGTPVTMQQVANLGELVVVVYWHKDCPACVAMIDDLNTMANSGLAVVGINVGDSADEVAKYVNSYGVKYYVLIGGTLPDGQRGVPVTEIYFRGRLERTLIGEQTVDTIGRAALSIEGVDNE